MAKAAVPTLKGTSLQDTGAENTIIQEISQQLTCSICLEQYKIPKTVIPCLHTFCQACLQDYIDSTATKNGRKGKFPCPKCRGNVVFDYPSAQRERADIAKNLFKTNFDIQSQLDVINTKLQIGCPLHCGESLMFYCKQCEKPVCQICLKHDHLLQNHELSSVEAKAQNIREEFQQKCPTHDLLILQHKKQITDLGTITTCADNLIKILDTSRQSIWKLQREVEGQIKQKSKEMEKFGETKDEFDELLSATDLKLVLNHSNATDILQQLKDISNDVTMTDQFHKSKQHLSDVFSQLSAELSKLAVQDSWMYATSNEVCSNIRARCQIPKP